jgi:hypothetical protein
MNEKPVLRFEAIARDLVEGKIGLLFGGRIEPLDVANRLARVMEDNINQGDGLPAFSIYLNREDFEFLTSTNPNLAEDISAAAWQIWQGYASGRIEKPQVHLVNDASLPRHKVRIIAEESGGSQDGRENTTIIHRKDLQSDPLKPMLALDAFLIIQGRRHVLLDRPLLTIGRHVENDIVIDLASVSRKHAQVRWRFGRFVLYDISARGKTMVNGQPIIEHTLKSGDVIALSDALLIYGEGQESGGDENSKTLIRVPRSK